MRVFSKGQAMLSRLPLLFAVVALAACADSSSGGKKSSTSTGTTSGTGSSTNSGPLRLVGFNRQALSPGAASRLWLVAERRNQADPASYSLEESPDGQTWSPASPPGPVVVDGALLYEMAWPATDTWYRLASPEVSESVRVDISSGAGSIALTSPHSGADDVSVTPELTLTGGTTANSFLYVIADASGEIVMLAEANQPHYRLGDAAFVAFSSRPQLAADTGYLATVVGVDDNGFGVATSDRIDFRTEQ